MSGQELSFANGQWWFLLPIGLVVILALFGLLSLWRSRVRRAIGEERLVARLVQASPTRRTVKRVLWTLGLLLAGAAALRPQFGMEDVPMKAQGIDLAIALDISNSMLVGDIAPDRLTGSVMELNELLDRMEGGRISLVPFAGIAYRQSPLTSDFEAIRLFLSGLSPADVPVPGTAIGRALSEALGSLTSGTGLAEEQSKERKADEPAPEQEVEIKPFAGSKYKAILLITDGEDHGSQPLVVAQKAAQLGIRIYVVGVGSPVGDLVPKVDDSGNETGEKVVDPDSGDLVVSRINEELLSEIAQVTGGKYFHYTGTPIAGEIYEEIEKLEKQEYAALLKELQKDRFQFLLFPALLLLMLELMLSERRRAS
jgi:Ca-activated chloride channel family protein